MSLQVYLPLSIPAAIILPTSPLPGLPVTSHWSLSFCFNCSPVTEVTLKRTPYHNLEVLHFVAPLTASPSRHLPRSFVQPSEAGLFQFHSHQVHSCLWSPPGLNTLPLFCLPQTSTKMALYLFFNRSGVYSKTQILLPQRTFPDTIHESSPFYHPSLSIISPIWCFYSIII